MTDANRERIAQCTEFISRFQVLYELFDERVQEAEAELFHLGYTVWLEPEEITDQMVTTLDRVRRLSLVRRMARAQVVRLDRERQVLYFGEDDDTNIRGSEYEQLQREYEQQHGYDEQRGDYGEGEQYGEAAGSGGAEVHDERTDGGRSENSPDSLGGGSANGHGGINWGTFVHAVFGTAV